MIRNLSTSGNALRASGFLLLLLLCITVFYFSQPPVYHGPPLTLQSTSPPVEYKAISEDLTVDWQAGGGDFDPRGKCPPDFFRSGFVLLCKKLGNGTSAKFLYHKGKKLLYRIDREVVNGQVRAGLHWVKSTRFNAPYRIAAPAYKGGKAVKVPNAKGGKDTKIFHYGEVVSKRRAKYRRELFRETHIQPGHCPEWGDIFNFMP